MADTNTVGSKGRILFLRNYLEEHTDDNHILTTEDLITLYKKKGYAAHRQTIADDVAVLMASGFDVITEQVARNKTKTNAYHVGARLFELSELKMLVDAVSSSRFITGEKSELLIRKLSKLTNEENRGSLVARIHASGRLKTTNSNVFVNIDTIYSAIEHQKKISFHYWDYSPTKEKVLRHDGAEYIASPYSLVRDDDRYYAASYSDSRQKVVTYRVDRMCDVKELEEDAYIDPAFNEAEYTRKVIKMYDDGLSEQDITLRCGNEFMKNVIDRFGEDVETKAMRDNTFRAKVNVVPSSTFFGWVMQYKGGILIERPTSVKKAFEKMLAGILEKQASR